jgi:hypothetical protein
LKNQYVGDVNDYIKYGLLRCFSETRWRIGVCWMLTPDEDSGQGGKTDYLDKASLWQGYDPDLFDVLSRTVGAGAPRRVSIVEQGSVIPNATFFSQTVPDDGLQRSAWFDSALNALSSCDLIFFDPDNGLQVPSKPPGSKGSAKHLRWSEVQRAWKRGVSLLIFQHFTREKRQAFVDQLKGQLEAEAAGAVVTPLWSAHVLFLLACQPHHERMAKVSLELVRSRWREKLRGAQAE